ncbi:MAG: hypothetical protein R3237_05295 [Nitrosopumilaceae archaeon]|nr:hypothetical protein [Nitrosopumilaceae archaeon]
MLIGLLSIYSFNTEYSYAALSKTGLDPIRHFPDLSQPEIPNYVEDTIGDVKIKAVFHFNKDGVETIDSFKILNQVGGYEKNDSIIFQLLGGVGSDKPKLYTVTDKYYAQGMSSSSSDYQDFDVDVYLYHRGDPVAFRHFLYLGCSVTSYSVATLHDGDETFSGKTKFVLADSFTFQCSGFQPHCPLCIKSEQAELSSTNKSTKDLIDTQTWSDLFR